MIINQRDPFMEEDYDDIAIIEISIMNNYDDIAIIKMTKKPNKNIYVLIILFRLLSKAGSFD